MNPHYQIIQITSLPRLDCSAGVPMTHLNCGGREGGQDTHRVQRGSCPHVGQESHIQHVQQEVLVLNAIYPVQEEHHRSLVVGHKGC